MIVAVVIGDDYFEVVCRKGNDDFVIEQKMAIEWGYA